MDYEALARQYGGKPENEDELANLARKFGGKPVGQPLTPLQGAGAVASGFNRSVLAGIPGLPVATALNVADLARAGYGYVGNKLGMLSPDEMPQPLERSHYVGSPEWIAQQIAANDVGAAAINNPRPDNATARVLNAGGSGIGAGMSANPSIAGMQFASGVSGQLATEAGADPAWALLASMAPQTAVTGGAMATRGAMRGGEEGRAEMEARLRQFREAGVDPTVGLATGNRRTQAVESLLSKVPGGAGTMAAKVEAMHSQMQNTANAARDQVSPVYGPVAAGEALKRGITGYRESQQDIYKRINDRAMDLVPENMRFPVDSIQARGAATLADIPGAPNVSRAINKPLGFTQEVLSALNKDAAPPALSMKPSQILGENGQPFMTPTPGNPGGLPIEAIKGLKGRIGELAYANNPLLADANTGALKNLYGGAKQDLLNAGALADAERVARGQQPGVLSGLQRGDKFYAQSQKILEDVLAPIYKAGDPASEKSFYRVESDLRNSGQQVTRAMASLPVEARRQTAATVIDRLGRAAPGQQNAEGSAFSPQTFLTNWNRITPEAKSGLFLGIPQAAPARAKLDALAKSASMIRDANKVYANPSGTAPAVGMIGTGIGLASGAMGIASGNVPGGLKTMAAVLTGMEGAWGGAKAMTNPRFVTWLSTTTALKPEHMAAHIRRLAVLANAEKDPEQRDALESVVTELRSQLGD